MFILISMKRATGMFVYVSLSTAFLLQFTLKFFEDFSCHYVFFASDSEEFSYFNTLLNSSVTHLIMFESRYYSDYASLCSLRLTVIF